MDQSFDKNFILKLDGDFHVWKLKLEYHVDFYQAWNFVSTGQPLTEQEIHGQQWTIRQLNIRAMRDILSSLGPDLLSMVSGCESAHEVFMKVRQIFLGSETAYRSQLLSDLFA